MSRRMKFQASPLAAAIVAKRGGVRGRGRGVHRRRCRGSLGARLGYTA